MLPRSRQRSACREIMRPGHQQLICRKFRDDFMPGLRNHDLLFNPRGAPAILRGPERLQRKHHPRLDLMRMLQRNQAADHRFLPDRQPDSMPILQPECRLFIRKSKLLRFRPHRRDLARLPPRTHQRNGGVQIIAAPLIRIHQRQRRVPDREAAVVTRPVTHIGMQDVVINRIAGS